MVIKSMDDLREHDVAPGDVLDLRRTESMGHIAGAVLTRVHLDGYRLRRRSDGAYFDLSMNFGGLREVWDVSDPEAA